MLAALKDRLHRRRPGRTIAHREHTTADLALENARDLCAVAGPWQVAADYGAMPGATLAEIAGVFARGAYHGDFAVQAAAVAGALDGFAQYLAAHPQDPYD